MLAGFVALVVLVGLGALLFWGTTNARVLVGFLLVVIGGLAFPLGELVGSRFGSRPEPGGSWPAVLRGIGFFGLTVGALVGLSPAVEAALESSPTLRAIYLIVAGLLFIGVVVAYLIAFLTGRR